MSSTPQAEPPESIPRERITGGFLDRLVAVGNALEHCDFNLVLNPEALRRFDGELTRIVSEKRSVGVGEFAVQCFLDDRAKAEELQVPRWWLALPYDFVVREKGVNLACKGQTLNSPWQLTELSRYPNFKGLPLIELEWHDIRDTFASTYDPHPRMDTGHSDDPPPA